MKRFFVFAGEFYYSAGGAANLIGSVDSLSDAWTLVDRHHPADWCHALDTETGEIIRREGWQDRGHGTPDI